MIKTLFKFMKELNNFFNYMAFQDIQAMAETNKRNKNKV